MVKGNFYSSKKGNEFHPKRKHYKFLIFSTLLITFLLSVVLFYTTEFSITGNAIKSFNESEYIPFTAEIGTPEMIVSKGNYEKVSIDAENMYLSLAKQDLDLTNSINNFIEIFNFSGELKFTRDGFEVLDGKAYSTNVNGVSYVSERKMNVDAVGGFDYSYLKIENKFYIKELDYETSGVLTFDGFNTITLKEENVSIRDFIGDLEIKNNKMFLNGYVRSINVEGSQKISVSK